MLLTELDEAREHLGSLINKMAEFNVIDESVYAVYLGHVFAQLNHAWNRCRLGRSGVGSLGFGQDRRPDSPLAPDSGGPGSRRFLHLDVAHFWS